MEITEIIIKQFTIGEEFALREFELEYLETKSDSIGISYDYYIYTERVNKTQYNKLILVYNCDILRGLFCFC
jgi:hypothetical protein